MEKLKDKLEFLSGGGEMGILIRSFDWSTTSVGMPETWPQSLRTAVSIVLNSAFPMFIWWGKDSLINIYNDAYIRVIDKKHPEALGKSGQEIWKEIWDDLAPLVDKVFTQGESVFMKDLPLTMNRSGYAEQTYFTFSYSPIRDELGNIGGMHCACIETTAELNAQAAHKEERERLYNVFMNAPAAIAIVSGPELVFQLANKPYRQLVGIDRQLDGKPLLEALPEIDKNLLEIVKNVAFKGESFVANELPITLDWDYNNVPYVKYLNFIYEPIFENNKPNGLIAFAYDVTEQIRSRQRIEEQNKVLEMINSGGILSDALEFLIHSIEKQSTDNMKCSVLLLDADGQHLRLAAAPSLPEHFNNAIDGITIGPAVGSCGTAAYTKEPVIVSDTLTDPLWKDFKELAKKHQLGSCWSTPIFSSENKVLGTFAMYYDKPHTPGTDDRQIIEFATNTAAIVIERKQAVEALQQREEQLKRFKFMADNATDAFILMRKTVRLHILMKWL